MLIRCEKKMKLVFLKTTFWSGCSLSSWSFHFRQKPTSLLLDLSVLNTLTLNHRFFAARNHGNPKFVSTWNLLLPHLPPPRPLLVHPCPLFAPPSPLLLLLPLPPPPQSLFLPPLLLPLSGWLLSAPTAASVSACGRHCLPPLLWLLSAGAIATVAAAATAAPVPSAATAATAAFYSAAGSAVSLFPQMAASVSVAAMRHRFCIYCCCTTTTASVSDAIATVVSAMEAITDKKC
jgi:hypothetical protein